MTAIAKQINKPEKPTTIATAHAVDGTSLFKRNATVGATIKPAKVISAKRIGKLTNASFVSLFIIESYYHA